MYDNVRLMEAQRQDYDALCKKMELGRIYRHDMRHNLAFLVPLNCVPALADMLEAVPVLGRFIPAVDLRTYALSFRGV